MQEKNKVNEWIKGFINRVIEHAVCLNGLDTAIGDGDHGDNMMNGVTKLKEYIRMNTASSDKEVQESEEFFYIMSVLFLSNIGGASGPLYAAAFQNIARAWNESTTTDEVIYAGIKGIKRIGHCEVGDKTMLDVWESVYEALKNDSLTIELIQESVEDTKNMQAKKGRASYFGERSIGHIDPGAQSSGYFFEAMVEAGIK